MKKLIAMLLALALTIGIAATALATGEKTGTTTLTATVPDADYTISIPADVTLEYGNTEYQTIGNVAVSNLVRVSKVNCEIIYTSLINGTKFIPVTYLIEKDDTTGSFSVTDADTSGTKWSNVHTFEENTVFSLKCKVAQAAWTSADPGTYTATLTFNFTIVE